MTAVPDVRVNRGGSQPPRFTGPLGPRGRLLYGIVGTIVGVSTAEFMVRTGVLDGRYIPPPSATLLELASLMVTSSFWVAVGQTLSGWALGLAIAFAIAMVVAVLMVSFEIAERALRPIVEFLRPVPSVALIPVAILIFGLGMPSKLFLVGFAAMWPLLVQTVIGLRDIDRTQLETLRSYRIPRVDRVLRVIVPNAMPYIATVLRIASTTALMVAIVVELIIGVPGLGNEISLAQAGNATVLMYALIMATGLLGLTLNTVTMMIERRVLRWHPSHREVH